MTTSTPATSVRHNPERIYDIVFLCCYLANVCMMSSVSLLFRYSDFIQFAGGDESNLGLIVGLGTVGAIVFRIVQGSAIDRLGAITIWCLSLIGLGLSLLWHLFINDVGSWQVFAARLLMNTCIAGVFGAWLSFVTLRVGQYHVAEVIGVVGSSGFIGMAIGPVIGDWIFATHETLEQKVHFMFLTGTALVAVSLLGAVAAGILNKTPMVHREFPDRTSVFGLLRDYHPGFLLVIAAVMGLGISIPGNFLRPFAESQQIQTIYIFFVTYNVVAFVSRLTFRKAPQQLGLRNTILLGLGLMAVSMLLYLVVDSPVKLMIPATVAGLAHSFLFPSVVAGGTAIFPKRNRGVATSLMLAMYDVGVLVGSPLAGYSISFSRSMKWPDYPITFLLMGLIIAAMAIAGFAKYARDDGSQLLRRGSPPVRLSPD